MKTHWKCGAMKIGQNVGYLSVHGDNEFQHVGRVVEVHPDGIPSCQEPMVKLEGKAGVVLWSHCIRLKDANEGLLSALRKAEVEISALYDVAPGCMQTGWPTESVKVIRAAITKAEAPDAS